MPGIALFVDFKLDADTSSKRLDDMLRLISRESWHVTRKTENAPLFLGRVDLEGSGALRQPIWIVDGNIGLALVGQFYLDESERLALSREAGSDTALEDPHLALALYKLKGLKLLEAVRGIFAVVIWHAAERKLIVANDRFGFEHIFYVSRPEAMFICSEAKGAACATGGKPSLDTAAFSDLLNFGYVLGDKTLYEGVKLLPSGSILTWQNGKSELTRYWEFWYRDDVQLRPAEELAKLHADLLRAASRRQVRETDSPVVALSGGLDCRMVAASLPEELSGIYALTWGKPGCTDARIAADVAQLFGFRHVVQPTPHDEFLDRFAKVVEISDGLFVGEASVRNLNLANQRELGRTFAFGHNLLGYFKPTPPGLDDVSLAEDALRAQPWSRVSRFLRPKHLSPILEARRQSVKEVLSQPLPSNYLARHQLIDQREFRLRFHFMALPVVRNAVDVRFPLHDYQIADIVGDIAPTQRADRRFYIRSLFYLSPEAARIRYANTGFPPALPFWLQRFLTLGTRARRNLLYRVQRVAHIPTMNTTVQPDAYWVRLYMTDSSLFDKVRALLLSPGSLSREYLVPEEVERHLLELRAGLHRHTFTSSIFLTAELALRKLFS